MKNVGNNKSLNSSLKDKFKFEFESRIHPKNLIIIDKNLANSKNKTKPEHTVKSNFALYKKSLHKNVKEPKNYNNSHLTERNLINFGISKEKVRNSFKKDNLNETEKTEEKYARFSPINKVHTNQSLRTPNVMSAKESTRISVTGKHSHAKSEIDFNNYRKTEKGNTTNRVNLIKSNPKYDAPPEKNINLVYSELAKQLKRNKHSDLSNNFSSNLNERDSNFSGTREKDSANHSVENLIQTNFKITSRTNINTLGFYKTTKENTFNTSKVNMLIGSNNGSLSSGNINLSRVENPEELHLFYVSLQQKTKSISLKFDNTFYDDSNLITLGFGNTNSTGNTGGSTGTK